MEDCIYLYIYLQNYVTCIPKANNNVIYRRYFVINEQYEINYVFETSGKVKSLRYLLIHQK